MSSSDARRRSDSGASVSCFPPVIDVEVGGLIQADILKPRVREFDTVVQPLPDLHRYVFGGGHDVVERRGLVIVEAMGHGVDHPRGDEFLEPAPGAAPARDGVGVSPEKGCPYL